MIVPADDADRMRLALEEARKGALADEVPVGAIVIGPDGALLGAAHDERMARHDPTAHAEVLALRMAGESIGDWRLEDCDLYVTLEPCPMCAGALILSRIRRVVYGAVSPKSGSVVSQVRLLEAAPFNHRVEALGGVLAEECAQVLSNYFKTRRVPNTPDETQDA